jgi:hypothetical protein
MGAVRGIGEAGAELARWHQIAEWTGQLQVVLLVSLVGLQVATIAASGAPESGVGRNLQPPDATSSGTDAPVKAKPS